MYFTVVFKSHQEKKMKKKITCVQLAMPQRQKSANNHTFHTCLKEQLPVLHFTCIFKLPDIYKNSMCRISKTIERRTPANNHTFFFILSEKAFPELHFTFIFKLPDKNKNSMCRFSTAIERWTPANNHTISCTCLKNIINWATFYPPIQITLRKINQDTLLTTTTITINTISRVSISIETKTKQSYFFTPV